MSMMGYRSKLVRSVVVLCLFYVGVSTAAFYFLGIESLRSFVDSRGLESVVGVDPEQINPLNAAAVATAVVVDRLTALAPWLGAGILVGGLAAVTCALVFRVGRDRRKRPSGGYRGLTVTLCDLERPPEMRKARVNITFPKEVPRAYHPLLRELIGFLQAHPKAYVGDGHSATLTEHTLSVIDRALDYPDADPLLVVAAAAHDIGKISAYESDGHKWIKKRPHDRESARWLARTESWWFLPEPDRSLLFYAVAHEHTPGQLPLSAPGLKGNDYLRLRRLVDQLRAVDKVATQDEKQRVLSQSEVREELVDAFLIALGKMAYQVPKINKKVDAGGWRWGDWLVLIEHKTRDYTRQELDVDVSAALEGTYRDRGKLSKLSAELFLALHERGWLVTEVDPAVNSDDSEVSSAHTDLMTVPVDHALWRLHSGTREFNGVFIVSLPDAHRHLYPAETPYTLTVLGPLKEVANASQNGKSGKGRPGKNKRRNNRKQGNSAAKHDDQSPAQSSQLQNGPPSDNCAGGDAPKSGSFEKPRQRPKRASTDKSGQRVQGASPAGEEDPLYGASPNQAHRGEQPAGNDEAAQTAQAEPAAPPEATNLAESQASPKLPASSAGAAPSRAHEDEEIPFAESYDDFD